MPDDADRPSAEPAVAVTPRMVFRWAVAAGFGLLAVALVALAVYAVRGVIVLAAIALFIAVSLDPAVRWLVRHRWRRAWAVALIFVLAFVVFAGLIAAVVPPLVREGQDLVANLPGYVNAIADRSLPLREFVDRVGLTQSLRDLAGQLPGRIGANVVGLVRSVFGALFSALTVIVLTIYFMADMPRLRRGVVRLFPPRSRPHVRRTVDVTVDKVGSYMIGNLFISLVAGVAAFVALTALGVPFALPLAAIVAVTDLIPMIGATLGAVICVVVAAVNENLWPVAVLVALYFVLYQQLENYLIAPRILRNAVDLPAVAVLLAALIGGTILGLVGALIAIPVAAVIKVLGSPMIQEMDAADPAQPGEGTAEPG